ncbi:MAG: hypothetical protein RMJ19_03010 [Gemmatales bacterium]|nr:hypothetical protein [Gemmatales bacterium]MCS7159418.1 hypothetical protein [Gemmatales bacterium]MDW8174617.1 hypothetical protein [Gemmatales bacterium]MDW8222744.1 hypothetical protein [Gemmatales bacterium]
MTSWLPAIGRAGVRACFFVLSVVTFGCQSAPLGLHDQLVRGSVVSADEARTYQPSWWSGTWTRWMSWFHDENPSDNIIPSTPAVRPVQPDDVTPATAWHVLHELRDEVERDLANPQD